MEIKLPPEYLQRMKSSLGEREFHEFLKAYEEKSISSLRLNPVKPGSAYADEIQIPWCKEGRYILSEQKFIKDPLWHAGTYYVQEASSMILGEIYKRIYGEGGPQRALDLCAAPGGKSTLLQSLLPEGSLLMANEVIRSRAKVLVENHIRLGISENLIITQNDPKAFSALEGFFDYIQTDVPCSGEGMFRKGDTALREWSESNCELSAARQKRILADILPALSKDGILVYSTCTFNPAENEENIHWAAEHFDMESLQFDFPEEWGITEVKFKGIFGYYFYPHKTKGEGLFISVLKKKSGSHFEPLPTYTLPPARKISALPENENLFERDGKIFYRTQIVSDAVAFLKGKLNILYAGVKMGELKGKDFIPAQAMTNFHIRLHHFPEIEITEAQALDFLRGKDPQVYPEKTGFYLLTFKGCGLGWIKFLGNRSNNLYPKGWRIRNY